ncbi:MAG TPA: cyclic nucleotide-binding domain-containing protein [Spirochaetia bacterium]|nr:cyclic nucleotide-binding domain-containing protein [Spirochaetia bacterium]
MGLIGVCNTNVNVDKWIREAFSGQTDFPYIYQFVHEEKKILEFLNFDLPELVIMNFSDEKLDMDFLTEQVRGDAWLHSFGIIGIYDSQKVSDRELFQKLTGLNILALIDIPHIRTHLVKCLRIIAQNSQFILSKEIADTLVESSSNTFTIENDVLAASIYAGMAVIHLLQRGCIDMEKRMLLQLALSELITNGIEHGNCGITYEEKTEALSRGIDIVELIEEKCQDPVIAKKRVSFSWEIGGRSTKFIIRDEGAGFDVAAYKRRLKSEDPLASHGRGIRMASLAAQRITYNKAGNEVTLVVRHTDAISQQTPLGFKNAEIVKVQKGDMVFNEGEVSDFLYYIVSGNYNVLHEGSIIGTLSSQDIFMGEMSFLLNNKRNATVKAETEGKLIKVSRKNFVGAIKKYPHYGIFLSKLLARRLLRANSINAQRLSAFQPTSI